MIWANIGLFFLNYKKIDFLKKIVIFLVFFGFFLVQSIILFRYEQDTYFLNSEILLILPLVYLFKYIEEKKILIIILIFVISSQNIKFLNLIKFNNSQSYCNYILENENFTEYYDYWTQKIPRELVLNFCNDKV